jgi:hypothetical protein
VHSDALPPFLWRCPPVVYAISSIPIVPSMGVDRRRRPGPGIRRLRLGDERVRRSGCAPRSGSAPSSRIAGCGKLCPNESRHASGLVRQRNDRPTVTPKCRVLGNGIARHRNDTGRPANDRNLHKPPAGRCQPAREDSYRRGRSVDARNDQHQRRLCVHRREHADDRQRPPAFLVHLAIDIRRFARQLFCCDSARIELG